MVSILEHAGVEHASRLQFFAWMQRYFRTKLPANVTPQQQNDDKFFVTMLAEDIIKNKPDLIYVDKLSYETFQGADMQLDYIAILSQHASFQQAWQAYHYLKTVEA